MKTYLGRVFRDIYRKIAGKAELEARFARLLGLVEHLLTQEPKSKNKLYSLHTTEVACIAKACLTSFAATRCPSGGCKLGIVTTNREGLVLAARHFEGNPYDGHTLKDTVSQAVQMTSVETKRIYVDKGFRGHDYEGEADVILSGRKRGLTPQMKRELK